MTITKFKIYEAVIIPKSESYFKETILDNYEALEEQEFTDEELRDFFLTIFQDAKEDIGTDIIFAISTDFPDYKDEGKRVDRVLGIIEGGYDPREKFLGIIFEPGFSEKIINYINDNGVRKFAQRFAIPASHEMIHDIQWSKVKKHTYDSYLKRKVDSSEDEKKTKEEKIREYYNDEHEMMSFAHDTIKSMIDDGMNTEEIMKELRNASTSKNRYLTQYLYARRMKYVNDKTFNKFLKYCYQYAEEYAG